MAAERRYGELAAVTKGHQSTAWKQEANLRAWMRRHGATASEEDKQTRQRRLDDYAQEREAKKRIKEVEGRMQALKAEEARLKKKATAAVASKGKQKKKSSGSGSGSGSSKKKSKT